MNKILKTVMILTALFILSSNVFSARLFYLSTDKSFSESEEKIIKVESEYNVSSIIIRVYKINDPVKFYNEQNNIHRPIIDKRKLRYFTPDVIDSYTGYLKSSLRRWARSSIPSNKRTAFLSNYDSLSMSDNEKFVQPDKTVIPIKDPNFHLLNEFEYGVNNSSDQWNYNDIYLNDLSAGIYLIEGISNYNVAYTVLNVTKYGFITKKSSDKLLIYTVNNENAEPVKNVDIIVFDRFKKEIKRVKTNDSGLAVSNISDNELFIIGKSPSGDYAFYDPKYYSVSGRDVYVYIYTDRPVYRGKDQVSFKGVIRSYKDDNYGVIKPGNKIKIDIVDSAGNVIKTIETVNDKDGIFSGIITLPDEPQSGRYLIVADINGKKFEGEFKVEYYKKPEFQVTVKPENDIYISGDKVRATIKANYYIGDPVKGGTVKYSIYRTKFIGEEWEKIQSKSFYITSQEYQYSQMELLDTNETTLDKNGACEINFTTRKDGEAFNYSIQTVISNDAGIPISGSAGFKVVPSNFKINIYTNKFVYLMSEKIDVSFFTSDYSNNPKSQKINVKISTETDAGKIYVFYDKEGSSDTKGICDINFTANKTGFVKIEVSGKDESGNITRTEKYIWIGEKNASFNYKGGMVKLILDKKTYNSNDTAKLLIVSPIPDVSFLYSVEGDNIYDNRIEKLSSNSALINIPLKSNYLPNVFVNISFLFNNQLYENTIKIDIPPIEKFVNVDIKPDNEVFAPNSSGGVKIKVTDINNKPVKNANISVAVVDEAIYAISNEIAVDVYKYFYPFRRNNVMTYSSIGFRFYGYSMDVNTELARRFYKEPTGIAAFKEGDMKERKDFKDTVLWIPSLITNESGEADFNINFASNITKWRITAIAITPETKVGKNIGSVITRNDFFTELSLPNYLNEKDEATFYSTTHNYTSKSINASFEMIADNMNVSDNKQEAVIEANNTAILSWKVTPQKIGSYNISLNSISAKNKDKITKSITVIPHSILKINSINKTLNVKNDRFTYILPENIKDDGQELSINISYGYFSTILDCLPYLVNYPYGCVEQTTSSFLPNLITVNSLKKFNLKLPEIEKKLPDIVYKGLIKLYGYQNKNGTWGWWKDGDTDIFMTSYVLYALTLTKNLGFQIDQNIFESGIDALSKNIASSKNDTEKVYALYVLSMNNKKYPSIREDLQKKIKSLSDYDLALLTLSNFNYNQKEDAKKNAEELRNRAKKKTDESLYWGDENSQYWYRDTVETTAWVIKALYKVESDSGVVSKAIDWIFNKSEAIEKGINYLMSEKDGPSWKSTRDTSAVIFAVTDIMAREKFDIDIKKYAVLLNNNKIGDIGINKNNFWTELKISPSVYNKYMKKENEIKISGMEKEKLFISFSHRYYTKDSYIKESNTGIKVERNYYKLDQYKDANGNVRYRLGDKISFANKNDNFVVEIKYVSDKKQNYIMVEDYFPAGCVPLKDFLLYNIDIGKDQSTSLKAMSSSVAMVPDFIDFKDQKVVFFISKGGQMSLYYVMTPVFKGFYKVLPAAASLMYFPDVRGNTNQNEFTVR